MSAHPALADYPVVVTLPVLWGDMDSLGHVNNTIYFRWFESGRIAYFERVQLWGGEPGMTVGPILAAATCDFRRQLSFPDTVRVGSRVSRLGTSSAVIQHLIVGERDQMVAAEGSSTIVLFDYAAAKSTPIPESLRSRIATLQSENIG